MLLLFLEPAVDTDSEGLVNWLTFEVDCSSVTETGGAGDPVTELLGVSGFRSNNFTL